MQLLTFNKEENGRWYIDLPIYLEEGGSKGDLEMVAGADTWLDFLLKQTPHSNTVHLYVSSLPVFYNFIEKYEEDETGGYYEVKEYNGDFHYQRMWLCNVVLYLFMGFPNRFYYELSS